jgi:intracellular sulfur oxidation DsrE/DsrF family protein
MMSRTSLIAAAVLVIGLGAGVTRARAEDPSGPLRAVIHVNFPEAGRQGHGLRNVANILREVGDDGAVIEVVCHGAGIGLVEKARTGHAEQVAELIRRGVRFVACEGTMRRNAPRTEDLLPGVATVPSGAVEVVRKQRDGYAYFKP